MIKGEVAMSPSSRRAFLLDSEDWQSYWQPWARFTCFYSYLHENSVQRGNRIYYDILELVLHSYFNWTEKWEFMKDGSWELAGTIKSWRRDRKCIFLLKRFSVIKQYVSLDTISVHRYALRPENLKQNKKFLGFKFATLEKGPVDICQHSSFCLVNSRKLKTHINIFRWRKHT